MSEGAFTTKSGGGIWHSLNRCVVVLILLAGAVPIAYSFLPEVNMRKVQDARLEELRAEVDKARMVLARHQREESLLKHDREYLEILARDLLDVMKPGETIYRVEPSAPAPAQMRLHR